MAAPPVKEREAVKKVYPYKRWWAKVDKMTDSQIIALYLRWRGEGKV